MYFRTLPPMARRYALVIGIDQYTKPLAPLSKTASDAQAVKRRLEESGEFQAITLLINKVTANELDNALERLLLQADRAEALIYFTGHGITASLGRQSVGVLATSDCLVKQQGDRVTVQVSGPDNDPVTFNRLSELVRQANLSNLVVWLDCCHSENLIDSFITQNVLNSLTNLHRSDYFFITACRNFEVALARRSANHSYFTGALLEALAPTQAKDGVISCGEVFDYLSRKLKGSGQEPRLMGYGSSIPIFTIAPTPAPVAPIGDRRNPYLGLRAFDDKTAAYFHGRSQAVKALLDCLAGRRVLTVFGPSGCGKSSLVKAGLLPALQQGGLPQSRQWAIVPLKLDAEPVVALHQGLQSAQVQGQPYVLLIDQFEELFTLCTTDVTHRRFVAALADLLDQDEQLVKVILVIRGDFLDRCAAIPESAKLINRGTDLSPYLVTQMSHNEMREAIEEPARQHQVTFAPGLVEQIIMDLHDEPGSLPLLQYALTQLWDTCINTDAAPELGWTGYEAIGGVQGALEKRADQFYQALHPDDRLFLLETLIPELINVPDDEEQRATKRRVRWQRLEEISTADQRSRVLPQLINERLLVSDERTVEVAHEALLSQTKLIKGWITANRETIRLRRRLATDCQEWLEKGRSENYLLSAGRLNELEEWQAAKHPQLSSDEVEFLKLSQAQRDQEQQTKLEQTQAQLNVEKQRTRIAIVAAMVIAGISALTGWQWRSADYGQIQALAASSNALFTANRNTLDALEKALAAGRALQNSFWFRNDDALQAEVMTVLAQSTYWVRERNRLEGFSNLIVSVSISPDQNPDQQVIAVVSDKRVTLLNLKGETLRTLEGHTDRVTSVSFSPDGQTIATTSFDQTTRLWDRQTGNFKTVLPGHKGAVFSAGFSPTEQKIVTVGNDGLVKLWDYQGNSLPAWKAHSQPINHVSFSPDGKTIITASDDLTAATWTVAGAPLRKLTGHRHIVLKARFNQTGDTIATASNDGSIILWNASQGTSVRSIITNSPVKDIYFHSREKQIVTSHDDNIIRLWSLDGKLLDTLKGHSGKVYSISPNVDSSILVSGSADKTVKIWSQRPWLRVLDDHTGKVFSVSFNADSSLVASASEDTTVKLWDRHGRLQDQLYRNVILISVDFSPRGQLLALGGVAGIADIQTERGQALKSLNGHDPNYYVSGVSISPEDTIATVSHDKQLRLWRANGDLLDAWKVHDQEIFSVRFSHDGQMIATGGADNIAKVWTKDKQLKTVLKGHTAQIYSIDFSPDDQIIATASEDNTVKVWKQDGTLLHTLNSHKAGTTSVRFSPSGKAFATASDDGTIKLWRLDGKLISTFNGHSGPVNSLSFSPDGKILATASSDKKVLLWYAIDNFSLDSLMQRGCSWLTNYLHRPDQTTSTDVCPK